MLYMILGVVWVVAVLITLLCRKHWDANLVVDISRGIAFCPVTVPLILGVAVIFLFIKALDLFGGRKTTLPNYG